MTSTLRSRRVAFGLVFALAGLTLAGCGSSGTNAESTPTTTAPAVTTTTAKAAETTTTAAATSTTKTSGAVLTVTPAENLTAGQVVQVSGTGFTPGKTLALAQCTAESKGPADCNSAAANWPKVTPEGTITGTVKIVVGPIGTSGHACNATTPCSIGTTDVTDPTGPNLSRVMITLAA